MHSFSGKRQYAAITLNRLTIKLSNLLCLEPKVSVCGARESNTLFVSERDVAYVCRAVPDINISDNGSRKYEKYHDGHNYAIDTVEVRGYKRFMPGFGVYFYIISSKNLQNRKSAKLNQLQYKIIL